MALGPGGGEVETVEVEGPAGRVVLDAELVVGADGVRSKVAGRPGVCLELDMVTNV